MSKRKVSGGTVFGKPVSSDKNTRFSEKWRPRKELHDAHWLIVKVIRIIGTPLDMIEFESQMKKAE